MQRKTEHAIMGVVSAAVIVDQNFFANQKPFVAKFFFFLPRPFVDQDHHLQFYSQHIKEKLLYYE